VRGQEVFVGILLKFILLTSVYKDVNWIKLAEDKVHGIYYGNDYSTLS
jgi:hypothetical protein